MPMSDTLRDRIAAALRGHGPMGAYYRDGLEFCSCGAETDGLLEFEAHLADAVIAVVSDEYINSRGMFHELDRCLGCEECNE